MKKRYGNWKEALNYHYCSDMIVYIEKPQTLPGITRINKSLSSLLHSKERRSEYIISDMVDFRSRKITGIQVYYIMIKGSIGQKDITNLKEYVPDGRG